MIDKAELLARSLGMTDAQVSKWSEFRAEEKDKPSMKKGVFNFEGPIIDSATAKMFGIDSGVVTPEAVRAFLAENEGEDIELNINSPGGSVFDANAIVSDLMRHEGKVKLVVTGACMSAAAMGVMTVPNAERVAMPGAMFMIHNAYTCACGDSNAMLKVAARLGKINEQYAARMEKEWGVFEKADLLSMMDEETYFTEQEALDAGIVQSVWEPKKKSKAAKKEDAVEDDKVADEAIARGITAAQADLLAVV